MNLKIRYTSYMIRGRRVLVSNNFEPAYIRKILRLLLDVNWDIWGWYSTCDPCKPNNRFHREIDLVPCNMDFGYHGLAWRDTSSIPG